MIHAKKTYVSRLPPSEGG